MHVDEDTADHSADERHALERHRDRGLRECRGEGQDDVGDHQQARGAQHDHPCAVLVDDRAARADDEEADQRAQSDQPADIAEREAPDLVEVDHQERQHQTGAQELHHDDGQQQPTLAGQVMPERGEAGRAVGNVLGHHRRAKQPPPTIRTGFSSPGSGTAGRAHLRRSSSSSPGVRLSAGLGFGLLNGIRGCGGRLVAVPLAVLLSGTTLCEVLATVTAV